jgi:hypothetical protein
VEFLFQLFAEFALQILFEAAAELGLNLFRRSEQKIRNPFILTNGFFAWGLAAGVISLLLFRHSFIANPGLRMLNLAVGPLVIAGIMQLAGKIKARRNLDLVGLDRYGYAFAFAFGMALVRFFFAT